MPYEKEAAYAKKIAKKAGEMQLRYYPQIKNVERKDDDSPVTIADKNIESYIREALQKKYPYDGIRGEEHGEIKGESGRTWIIDPIDGTVPYIKGIPTFSCLIALLDGVKPVAGVMYFPVFNELYWASEGKGAYEKNIPIHVSTQASLSASVISCLGPMHEPDNPKTVGVMKVVSACKYPYGFMDAYTYALVASGRLDAGISMFDKPWDCAAAACIVAEAGGAFSDFAGGQTIESGNIILSNKSIHQEILSYIK
jgi:histidinol phosphatase-like enzyme (inositol monophosphatase family)